MTSQCVDIFETHQKIFRGTPNIPCTQRIAPPATPDGGGRVGRLLPRVSKVCHTPHPRLTASLPVGNIIYSTPHPPPPTTHRNKCLDSMSGMSGVSAPIEK